MKRLVVGLLAISVLLPSTPAAADRSTGSGVASATPVGAVVTDFPSACPEMTDSIYRLYTAYFLREPDGVGWDYWFDTYGSALDTNLEVVSAAFADSDEFRTTYGALTNAQFVTLVYENVLGRTPDTAGFDHWKASLDRGYPRGSVMIAFSESAEYVALTDTVTPLAGYLAWYDRSLMFACDAESPTLLQIEIPAEIRTPYVDVALFNPGEVGMNADITFFDGNSGTVVETLSFMPESYHFLYNLQVPRGAISLVVQTDNNIPEFSLGYTVAFYDHPHSATRVGWE